MANENENKSQQDNNKLLAEAKGLLSDINRLRQQMGQNPVMLSDNEAIKSIQSLRNEYSGLKNDMASIEGTASDLYGQLKAISGEILGGNDALKDGKSAFRSLNSAARDLRDHELGINMLNQSQLEKLHTKLEVNKQAAVDAADRLVEEDAILASLNKQIEALEEGSDEQIAAKKAYGDRLQVINAERAALIQATEEESAVISGIIAKTKDQIDLQKEITSQIGVTGALVGGLNGLFGKLGLSSSYLSESIKESEEAMREVAEAAASAGGEASKLSIIMAGLRPLGSAFTKTLFSAEVIVGAIVNGFFDVNKASTKLQQLTGQNSTALAGFNSELASSVQVLEVMAELTAQTGRNAQNIFTGENLAQAAAIQNTLGLAASEAGNLAIMAQTSGTSIEDVNRSIVDTTSNFNKSNKSAVSQGQILRDVANTSDDIKLSLGGNPAAIAKAASAARKLGMDLSRVDQIADSLLDFESSIEAELEAQLLTGKNINMAKARELALNNDLAGLGKELFNNSADIHEFGKMNRIQQEAQAKALGMSRQELAKIAYNRALDNDMTKEQAAAAANVKLEDMERLAVQDKLALAATKLAQAFAPMLEILIPIADLIGFIARMISLPVSGLMNLADSIKGTEESASSFRGILSSIVKLIGGAGFLLLGKTLKDAFNPNVAGGLLKQLKSNFNPKNLGLKNLKKSITGLFSKGTDAMSDATPPITTSEVPNTPGLPKTPEVPEVQEPKTSGQGIREFLTNLAEGLKAMGSTKVLGGALNLIPASIGFVAFIPGYFGAKLMERLDGEAVKESLTGLAEGLGAFGTGRVTLGAVNLIAASAGFVASLFGIPGMYAIGPAGQVASRGIQALVAPLTAFAATTAGIGSLALLAGTGILLIPGSIGLAMFAAAATLAAPAITALNPALIALGTTMMTGVGAIGLAALAAAALALGASLGMAGPGIEAFGSVLANFAPIIDAIGKVVLGVFQSIPDIIQAAADGFVTMFDAIAGADVGKLFLLGPALISAAAGIAVFSAVLAASSMVTGLSSLLTGGGVLGDLKELAAIAAPMSTLGTSLVNVAAGIAAIATALSTLETEKLGELKDLVVTTAFAAPAIAATGAITEMISGLTGGGSEDSSNQELLAEIKLLRAAVEAGGDVYIDGNKAGQSLMMASSKLS